MIIKNLFFGLTLVVLADSELMLAKSKISTPYDYSGSGMMNLGKGQGEVPVGADSILLESGDHLLLESGDRVLTE